MTTEQLLSDREKDKTILKAKLERLEENVGDIQNELRTKTNEVEEESRLQKQLSDYISLNNSESLKHREQLEKCEKEKDLLVVKVIGLEDKVNELGRTQKQSKRGD